MYINAPSKAMKEGNLKFSFLCGTFDKKNFIYATKFAKHSWHYFDVLDSVSSKHISLPASMDSLISKLDKVKLIDVNLNEEQSRNYYDNGKFIFKNKELKTHTELDDKQFKNQPSESNSSTNSTRRLVFVSGQTNPLFFLNKFEKCHDLKTDRDKMYKIRYFVDECHKAEFTKLYFTCDWLTVRSSFLTMYSLSFAENKKRELQIDFNEAATLRSFVERKLMSLAKFTTLPFINQIEIVMSDLPVEISSLFVTKEIMTGKKSEILDFCDSIQELVGTMRETTEVTEGTNQQSEDPSKRMEIFDFNSESEPSEPSESDAISLYDEMRSSRGRVRGESRGRGRGRGCNKSVIGRGISKRGRPSKKLKTILESNESSGYEFLNEMDNSSRSSWSN